MMLVLGDKPIGKWHGFKNIKMLLTFIDDMLKKSVAWSCLGNPRWQVGRFGTQSGPIDDIFNLP